VDDIVRPEAVRAYIILVAVGTRPVFEGSID
jgi:hypothetical protein